MAKGRTKALKEGTGGLLFLFALVAILLETVTS